MSRLGFLLGIFSIGLAAHVATAATITVDSTADDLDIGANGNCTLREALVAANSNQEVDACPAGDAGPAVIDRIVLPAGIYTLAIAGTGEGAAQTGDLDVSDELELEGEGADVTLIDAAQTDRVFDVGSGVVAAIEGVTMTGGDEPNSSGGGIRNGGTLTLLEVVVTGNSASGPGGGIRNDSDLTVVRSTLDGNVTDDHGGGVDNHGTSAFQDTTVSGNTVNGGGAGGGLYNLGGETMTVMSVTVFGNAAGSGSGILNNGDLTIGNSLVEGGCSGDVTTSLGGNLESPADTCGLGGQDQTGVADPGVDPLADNGGPTPTHALAVGSPAIDAAVTALCGPVDQRRAMRPADGDGDEQAECDIGAFEALAELGPIFEDGFESGDTTAWGSVVP